MADPMSSTERHRFLQSLSAEEKAHILLLDISEMEIGAKVGVITDEERIFIRETMTDDEREYYRWAILHFHF